MDPAELIAGVSAGFFAHRDTVAGMTLIAYDYILMFAKEREHIWKARWTPGKVLYLLVRYFAFVDIPILLVGMSGGFPSSCEFASYWQMTGTLLASIFAELVYTLRTWALWNRSRFLGIFLAVCGIGFGLAALVVLLAPQPDLTFIRIPGFFGCFPLSTTWNGVWAAYILAAGYQLILFVATALKGLLHLRHQSAENLTTVLYRDAFFSFLAQFCIGVVNVLLQIRMGNVDYGIDVSYRALLSVLPSRIILNIREAAGVNSLDNWDVTRRSDSTTVGLSTDTS